MSKPSRLHCVRKFSDAHVLKLKKLKAQINSSILARRLHTSEELILDASSGGAFKPATVDRLEPAIDALFAATLGERAA